MLQFLAIRDFALIDRLEVEFAPGLNLLTGETGSGKSILIDAVAQLIGDRASLDLIRAGSDSASIQGIFRVESEHPAIRLLAGQEIAVEGQEIVIRRVISPTGSKVFVNGVLSTQRFLAQLGTSLADIHGQHDRHGLIELFQQALVGAVVVVETLVQSSDQILELQDVTLKANDFFFGTGSKRPGNQEENERQVLLHKRGVVKHSADDEVGTPVTSVGCFVLAGVGRSLLAE